MSQYVVIDPQGRRFGPADFQTLAAWAREGRVAPGMLVEDVLSGQSMMASGVPGLFEPGHIEAPPAPTTQSGGGIAALAIGLIGLAAWCVPPFGIVIGFLAILFGVRALSHDRSKGVAAIGLGVFCTLMSLVAGVLMGLLLKMLS